MDKSSSSFCPQSTVTLCVVVALLFPFLGGKEDQLSPHLLLAARAFVLYFTKIGRLNPSPPFPGNSVFFV